MRKGGFRLFKAWISIGSLLAIDAICFHSAAQAENLCRTLNDGPHAYTVCEAPLDRFSVKLFWRKTTGEPYNYLNALPKAVAEGERLVFAINGGMFHPDYKPVGLYIEGGREMQHVSTANGPGNFHLKPNGIFYISGGEGGVLETGAYLKRRPKAELATQSGPMLVIDGKLHPRVGRATSSEKKRDGVCVRDGNVAVFAISEAGVSFADFSKLFRDRLRCRNALFLDGGSAPALYAPSINRGGNTLVALGPMIGVYEKASVPHSR